MLKLIHRARRKNTSNALLVLPLAVAPLCTARLCVQAAAASAVSEETGIGMPAQAVFVFLAAAGCLLFFGIQPVIGLLSGWRRLARLYPKSDIVEGQLFRITQGAVGRVGNKNIMRLRAGHSHLHFSMMRFFSLGHAPFSVPWSDISATHGRHFFQQVARFTFAKAPNLRVSVPADIGERVIAASQGQARFVDVGKQGAGMEKQQR